MNLSYDVVVETLSKILKERHDIEMLIIANCNIDESTASELLMIITQCTQLRFVDISGNNLSDDTVQAFQAIVEKNLTQGLIQEDGARMLEPFVCDILAWDELTTNVTLSDNEANMHQEVTNTSLNPGFYPEEFSIIWDKNDLEQL